MYIYIYIYVYIYIYIYICSEGQFTISRESSRYAGPSAGAEVSRLRKWHDKSDQHQ